MSFQQHHVLFVVLTMLLLALSVPIASAQTPSFYRGYGWKRSDTTFLIGNHDIGNPRHFHDTLRLDFGQIYNRPTFLDANDTSEWAIEVRDAYATGYKFIYPPEGFRELIASTTRSEHFLGLDDPGMMQNYPVHGYDFSLLDNSLVERYGVQTVRIGTFIPHDSVVTRNIQYTRRGLQLPWQNLNDSIRSWRGGVSYDSITFFRVGMTIRAEGIDTATTIGTNDVIAKAYLYRRVDTLQKVTGVGSCNCAIFDVFDSIVVTKGKYEAALDDPSGRELAFRTQSSSGTEEKFYEFAKSRDFIRSYNPVTDDTLWQVRPGPFDQVFGKGNGPLLNMGTYDSASCSTYCDSLVQQLINDSALSHLAVNDQSIVSTESDLVVQTLTTGRLPITVARITISPHMYEVLRRGELNPLIGNAVAPFFRIDQDTLREVIARLCVSDEPEIPQCRADGYITARLQDTLWAHGDTTSVGLLKHPLYITSNNNFDAIRLLTGDMDTTRIKILQAPAIQFYPIKFPPIAIKYANPHLMDSVGREWFYGLRYVDHFGTIKIDSTTYINTDDTVRIRIMMGNSGADYNYHTKRMQEEAWGSFADRTSIESATGDGPSMIPKLARAVDVAQFKYADRPNVVPHPVWYVVQVHGYVQPPNLWFLNRIPTPEEITCQSFLGLNCGINSMMFSDFVDDGSLIGVMKNFRKGVDSSNYGAPLGWMSYPAYGSNFKMWTGMLDRYNAVKRVVNHFRDTILPVYKKLIYNQEQISIHDSARQSFDEIPMLDTLVTERAVPTSQTFTASGLYDPRSQTYVEATHLTPGAYDTLGRLENSHYLLLTNRRTYPQDFTIYPDSVRHYFDDIASFYGSSPAYQYSDTGLGNIDVRRPWIRLKNSTAVMSDSFRIEKIGGGFVRTVHIDSLVALDWLTPGWGAMYKITPIPQGISAKGSAFNNAIRSENVSQDTTPRQRIVTYERDSAVYISVQDENGAWGKEWLISDPVDTSSGSGRAFCIHPALATVRNGTSCMIVYERRAHSIATVKAVHIPQLPTGDSLPPFTRTTLSANKTLSGASPYNLAPAIVGIDSGYICAWAVPSSGIEVVAVRDVAGLDSVNDVSNVNLAVATTVKKSLRLLAPGVYDTTSKAVSSLSQFPTLAYVRNYSTTPTTLFEKWHIAHLAWQQGDTGGSFIFHKPVGARFPTAKPVLYWDHPIEHASQQLGTCRNEHPCITADSLRIAITFETIYPWMIGGPRVIVLRFRDSVLSNGTYQTQRWSTPAYYFGTIGKESRWSSVTEFPLMSRSRLNSQQGGRAEGGLVWTRQETDGTRRLLYRYGMAAPVTLSNGVFPTMTLVPYIYQPTEPFSFTSIYYRGDDSTYFLRNRPFGLTGTGRYYPGILENTPTEKSAPFAGITSAKGAITSFFQAMRKDTTQFCEVPALIGGIRWDKIRVNDVQLVTRLGDQPELPQSFFTEPIDGATSTISFEEAMNVTRSSTFTAGSEPVTISRVLIGAGDLLGWLSTMPYDSTMGSEADIKIMTELVRAVDDVVLWQADTISARTLSGTTLNELVEVPVDEEAPGTEVYIRLRAIPTEGLDPVVSAGFGFDDDTTTTTFQKVIRPRQEERASPGMVPSLISVSVVPNPATSHGQLYVHLLESGDIHAAIYDMLGHLIMELPIFNAVEPGDYSVELDLSALPRGMCTVQVEQGNNRASTRFTVVR